MADNADETLGTPELFQAIGRVAYTWADLESELGLALVAVLHAPLAAILTVGQNYSVINDHLQAVLNLNPALEQYDRPRNRLDPDLRQRLKDELAEAKRLNDLRNLIIHGLWLPQPGGTADDWQIYRPRQRKLLMPPHRITIGEMVACSQQITATSRRIRRIGQNIDHEQYGLVAPPAFD